MHFHRRAAGHPSTLGILPGTFNPPTIAHLAIAGSALGVVDEVVFVLPRVFPHKRWSGASFDQRLALLTDAARDLEHTSIASSDKGLFVEIAHDCREQYGREVKLSFLCGADAAERIANWDYGDPAAFGRMMEQFDLLVAERGGRFSHPHRPLPLPADYGHVSATAVRERIARGEAWEHLVPPSIRDRVRAIYRSEPATGRTR